MFSKINRGDEYTDRGNLLSPDFQIGDLTIDAAYHELDLSGIIPKHTKLVVLSIMAKENTLPHQFVISTNGAASGFNASIRWLPVAGMDTGFQIIVAPNILRKISYLITTGTWEFFSINITGWYK